MEGAKKIATVEGSAAKQNYPTNRPTKPDVDPLYLQVRMMLERDSRSLYAKAAVSGLSPSTFKNWGDLKTKRPQSVSLQMAARMLGMKIVLVRE